MYSTGKSLLDYSLMNTTYVTDGMECARRRRVRTHTYVYIYVRAVLYYTAGR